jgi:hypothetical protein
MNIFAILTFFVLNSHPSLDISYSDGYYYSKRGERVSGLIKIKPSNYTSFKKKKTRILFKSDIEDVAQEVTLADMQGFVVEQDSFAVVQNFKINHINGVFDEDFAKVVQTGKMNLYAHRSLIVDTYIFYERDRYILSKDGNNFLGIWNAMKQREEISLLFADNPELMNRILKKEFDNKIPELVALYNQ